MKIRKKIASGIVTGSGLWQDSKGTVSYTLLKARERKQNLLLSLDLP